MWAALHFMALAGLCCYGLHRLWLLVCWNMERRKPLAPVPPPLAADNHPSVTIQLPLYNERFVASRLLDAVARMDWPRDKLEIQVLDDSTDDTRDIVDERSNHWRCNGINMQVIRREHREGYKAGALQNGLRQAQGEYIAIFDADFVPPPEFLLHTIPCFSDERIGMVQARWDFLNAGYSWLCAVQSLLLGPHFSIEHWVRFKKGWFFNFNGTAGIWRRKAIESAGGWQSDTVTEDLDLSYRAQLAGWRFVYLDGLAVPSELPVTLASFRSQQQRWAKGSIQTARKILPRLLVSSLPVPVKLEAIAHLLANVGWLLGAVVALTVYPVIVWRVDIGAYQLLRIDLPLFLCTSVAILLYFFIYAKSSKARASSAQLLLLPILGIGMAPCLALSVLNGAFSRGGIFQRTPKFGIHGHKRLPGPAFIYRQPTIVYLFMNAALFAYSLMPVIFAWQRGTWPAILFLALFPLGFSTAFAMDLKEMMRRRDREEGS
jgi:cellulose synthase/poly-beta-1,6-N-acetylglucosamine synthase-like glycosyltransferase